MATAKSTRNPNKIITIDRVTDNNSWRNTLARLISGQSGTDNIKDSKVNSTIVGGIMDFEELQNYLNVPDEIDLLLDQDFPEIKTDNHYNKPIKDAISGLSGIKVKGMELGKWGNLVKGGAELVGSIINGVGADDQIEFDATSEVWNPWVQNLPVWSYGDSGKSILYTFTFKMGQYGLWNAKKEVCLPILNLYAMTASQFLSSFTIAGPQPAVADMITKTIGGLISDALGADNQNEPDTKEESNNFLRGLGRLLQNSVLSGYDHYTYNVKFGNILSFNRVMAKNSRIINLSKELDKDGFPISGSIEMTFEGIIPTALTTEDSRIQAIRFGNLI